MSSKLLGPLVFISGMTVMAVEMTALRLLAPFFGTSLLVTTAVIGSMMTFLSAGYWIGGKIGDRYPALGSLSKVTAAASLGVLVIPFISQPILRAAAAAIRPLLSGAELAEPQVAFAMIAGGLLGTLALLALPITLLGTVSPWAVRLAVDDVETTGQAAGRLYALSTVGSILGSFLPALYLLPTLGVRDTFLLLGGIMLTMSGVCLLRGVKGAAMAIVPLPLMAIPEGTIRPMDGLVEESESLYHFIQIVVEPYPPCDEAYHLYLNEGVGVHSVKCIDPGKELRGVWTYMAAAPLFREDPHSIESAMIIGLAGGTVARQLLDAFPQVQIDGVEIDGAVIEVGREYLDIEDDRINPIVMDGRIYLNVTDEKWDLVMMDAYRQPYIPFHLTTVEFWEEVKEHLSEDGVVAINAASVRGSSRRLAQMIYRTLKEVFPSVHLIDATQSNDMIYATMKPTNAFLAADNLDKLPKGSALDRLRPRLRKRTMGPVEGWEDAQLLTDDQAPVEIAWEMMALDYLK